MIALSRLLIEMVVVGLGLVAVAAPLHKVAMHPSVLGSKSMTSHVWLAAQVAVAGALFHFLCEVFGVNDWYCGDRAIAYVPRWKYPKRKY